jgi:hypothetical protein
MVEPIQSQPVEEEEGNYPFDNPVQMKFLEEAMAHAKSGEGLIAFENIEELRLYIAKHS